MGLDLTPRCAKCGCELNLNAMKALPEGKGFVCFDCYDRGNSTRSPFEVDKTKLRSPIPTSKKYDEKNDYVATGDNIFNQKEYECYSCGYSFKKSSEFKVTVCPYCGKREVGQKIEETAEDLLND